MSDEFWKLAVVCRHSDFTKIPFFSSLENPRDFTFPFLLSISNFPCNKILMKIYLVYLMTPRAASYQKQLVTPSNGGFVQIFVQTKPEKPRENICRKMADIFEDFVLCTEGFGSFVYI